MDLRTGCVYWVRDAADSAPACPALREDVEAEVAIIGGGITGAMAAYDLARAGVSCVMVDRRDVARGSTAASTGLLQYEIDKPLVELAERVGRHAAVRAYLLGVEALGEFERVTGELGDDCGFARTRSLLLASEERYAELLREETAARRGIGLGVEFLGPGALKERFGIERAGAILSAEAGKIDPVRFTSALITRGLAGGLRAFGQTQVDRYEADERGVTLVTDGGARLRAGRVIFATGYETPEFLKGLPVALKSTYAVAGPARGAVRADWPLVWETGTPYFYMRTDGEQLIVGGEDDDFADPAKRDARILEKAGVLVEKLGRLGFAVEADCAWAGTFAETRDSLPFIGPHGAFPRGLFALGYGGNGITFGLIAARLLRDRVLGVKNTDEALFAFDR